MAKSANTVTISSKLPFPLVMELQEGHKVNVEVFGGGAREITRYSKTGQRVIIKGCAYERDKPVPFDVVGGAALTHGVDSDFAERWFKQNQGNPIVIQGLVEAHASSTMAKGAMREKRAELSGFEPVNPNKFPEEFREVKAETKVDVEDID